MSAGSIQRVQDSIHGLMEFRGSEALVIEVLRCPEIQRLRKIRQLGLVHYVFPGAEHSRLTHSLGAAHLAIRFGHQLIDEAREIFTQALMPDEDAVADLALAGLCHDLGHGPLSHAWEREIVGDSFDRVKWAKALGLEPNDPLIQGKKWHEVVGHGLLTGEDGLLHKLLESQQVGTCTRIRQLLGGQYYLGYLPRLLNSDVDVDRADFIMRDTHYTGVAYGRFDLNWLVSTCTIGEYSGPGGPWAVGFEERKALRVIEQFLIARRALYDTVHYHKAVRCIEGMMGLLLRRLKEIASEGSPVPVADIVKPMVRVMQGEALPPQELLMLDDFSLSVLVDSVASGAIKDDTATDLARRIQARDLFKLVPVPSERIAEFVTNPGGLDALYDAVKPYVPGPSKYYLLVDRTNFEMLSKRAEERVLLVDTHGKAYHASEHPALASYAQDPHPQMRLFTVRQAVGALAKMIAETA